MNRFSKGDVVTCRVKLIGIKNIELTRKVIGIVTAVGDNFYMVRNIFSKGEFLRVDQDRVSHNDHILNLRLSPKSIKSGSYKLVIQSFGKDARTNYHNIEVISATPNKITYSINDETEQLIMNSESLCYYPAECDKVCAIIPM